MGISRKILMLVENAPVPTDSRVWPEAKALRDQGYRVSVISPKGPTQHRESYICLDGIHVYRYKLPQPSSHVSGYIAEYGVALVMTFWLSLKVLFRHGFDVIHAANPPDMFFLIGMFYRLFGKKYVFDQHDLAPEMFEVKFADRLKPLHKLLLFMERRSYRTADMVIVTNTSQKRMAMKRGQCASQKVMIVRNGPDLQRMKLVTPEPALKQGRRFLLAYVGIMAAQDGCEYALYALEHLVHQRGREDVSLVMIGDGERAPALRDLARELNVEKYVHFTGWITSSEMMRYLTVADVGMCPDPQNGLNEHSTMIKTMEYMAAGKPVVAFDLFETRYSAQDAALYASPNNVEEFARNIEILLDDDDLRMMMGKRGRKRIEEELSWEHSKKYLQFAYDRLFPRNTRQAASTSAQNSDELESSPVG